MDIKQERSRAKRRVVPKTDSDGLLLLVAVLIAAVCIAASIVLSIPQALDAVVNLSHAASPDFQPLS